MDQRNKETVAALLQTAGSNVPVSCFFQALPLELENMAVGTESSDKYVEGIIRNNNVKHLQSRLHDIAGIILISRQECKNCYYAKRRARANGDLFSLQLANIDGRYHAARLVAAKAQDASLRNVLKLLRMQESLFGIAA